jgi:hypothetical protein
VPTSQSGQSTQDHAFLHLQRTRADPRLRIEGAVRSRHEHRSSFPTVNRDHLARPCATPILQLRGERSRDIAESHPNGIDDSSFELRVCWLGCGGRTRRHRAWFVIFGRCSVTRRRRILRNCRLLRFRSALGSAAERHAGSTPAPCTKVKGLIGGAAPRHQRSAAVCRPVCRRFTACEAHRRCRRSSGRPQWSKRCAAGCSSGECR